MSVYVGEIKDIFGNSILVLVEGSSKGNFRMSVNRLCFHLHREEKLKWRPIAVSVK